MSADLWISTSDAAVQNGLKAGWLRAGALDTSRETDLWSVVQGHLGIKSLSKRRSVDFYGDLEPDSAGWAALCERSQPTNIPRGTEFWLALEWVPSETQTVIFYSRKRAEVAGLTRRPPEMHPGLITPAKPVPITLRADDRGFFDRCSQ